MVLPDRLGRVAAARQGDTAAVPDRYPAAWGGHWSATRRRSDGIVCKRVMAAVMSVAQRQCSARWSAADGRRGRVDSDPSLLKHALAPEVDIAVAPGGVDYAVIDQAAPATAPEWPICARCDHQEALAEEQIFGDMCPSVGISSA
jgi:hypothetical protein